jgi:hypothetical protein
MSGSSRLPPKKRPEQRNLAPTPSALTTETPARTHTQPTTVNPPPSSSISHAVAPIAPRPLNPPTPISQARPITSHPSALASDNPSQNLLYAIFTSQMEAYVLIGG